MYLQFMFIVQGNEGKSMATGKTDKKYVMFSKIVFSAINISNAQTYKNICVVL